MRFINLPLAFLGLASLLGSTTTRHVNEAAGAGALAYVALGEQLATPAPAPAKPDDGSPAVQLSPELQHVVDHVRQDLQNFFDDRETDLRAKQMELYARQQEAVEAFKRVPPPLNDGGPKPQPKPPEKPVEAAKPKPPAVTGTAQAGQAAESCAGGSCSRSSRWYPGKRLGR